MKVTGSLVKVSIITRLNSNLKEVLPKTHFNRNKQHNSLIVWNMQLEADFSVEKEDFADLQLSKIIPQKLNFFFVTWKAVTINC